MAKRTSTRKLDLLEAVGIVTVVGSVSFTAILFYMSFYM
jgi:hypothetical protein